MREVDRIAAQLTASYIGDSTGDAWYGPALRPLLDRVSYDDAVARPLENRHSIIEIVMHISANIEFVLDAIAGKEMNILPEIDWPDGTNASEDVWKKSQDELNERYLVLLEKIRALNDDQLRSPVVGRSYPLYDLLHGIIQHNVYHSGQIALLRSPRS